MKPDGLDISICTDQISHHRLEQDKIPLQPGCCVVVRFASRVYQFPGQELGYPGALGTESLQQGLDELEQLLFRRQMPGGDEVLVMIGKPSASLHDYGLIKSFLAVEVVTDPRHIGPGAFADFAQVRSVKSSLGEQLAGDLKDAVARGQWAPYRASRPICFFTLPDLHTKAGFAVAVPTAFRMQKVLGYNYLKSGDDS